MEQSIVNKNWQEIKSFFSEETKKHSLLKYLMLSAFIIGYFIYESKRLGPGAGFWVTALTWSFFIFSTPIADAGFVLAFPIRLIANIRMIYTQSFSYIIAFLIVIFNYIHNPNIYNKTVILKLFNMIITNPYPYWIIFILSFIGTFLSIYFADELIDVSKHEEREKYHKHAKKYKTIIGLFIIAITITLYYFLLDKMKINF